MVDSKNIKKNSLKVLQEKWDLFFRNSFKDLDKEIIKKRVSKLTLLENKTFLGSIKTQTKDSREKDK